MIKLVVVVFLMASEMFQQVKVLAAKPNDPSLIQDLFGGGKELTPICIWSTHASVLNE